MFREDRSIALTDFGVSRGLDITQALTMPGEVLGTPYYMSPEQSSAEEIDERSDLYSLGAFFSKCLRNVSPTWLIR